MIFKTISRQFWVLSIDNTGSSNHLQQLLTESQYEVGKTIIVWRGSESRTEDSGSTV